ncbi:iron-containing alcohol dehydrogenase family protein [Hutsoniella sourekii]|uniref:iron-containing alcohol dehydrogenase family protein n=1 Tax=Hutsoniella sourekii TaxID=87650 RepID=UPI0004B890CC|nr:iron-containing alcohol dehydrogenase family protein [Hutsoniella sourekii]
MNKKQTIYFPDYTIGLDAYDAVVDICRPYGQTVAIIGGQTALSKAGDLIEASLTDSDMEVLIVEPYGGEASYENVERLGAIKEVQAADLLFAVGGGRAQDTVKNLAAELDKPLFTFPTIASNCAPVTEVCVMYTQTGEMKDLYYRPKPPIHCFINSQVIAQAPARYLWAGIGDALSKEIESHFSARGRDLSYQDALALASNTGTNQRLMRDGKAALDSVHQDQVNSALESVIQDIIISTGITSIIIDPGYNIGLAHSFYNAATYSPKASRHEHGALVSYGLLILLTIDQALQERDQLHAFMKTVDLPTQLGAIDLSDPQDLDLVLDKMMQQPDHRVSPYPINKEMVKKAIQALESL